MQFDPREAKLLKPGQHITINDCPGLRLKATTKGHAWTYRYKSPINGLMKQVKIGAWPAMSAAAAAGEWDKLRQVRETGQEPGVAKRAKRAEARAAAEAESNSMAPLTVRQVCDLYLEGHIARHRKPKGQAEITRLFNKMLGRTGEATAETLTRTQAFDLLDSHGKTPVLASNLRCELGAAWDYALDAGKLPESTPNWWRQIMRGRLRSAGRMRQGKRVTTKRVLAEWELAELIPWLPNFSRTVADALTLYLWTGTRGAEIMAIEGSEVRKEKDGLWWVIPKEKTKNARHEEATDLRVPLVGRAEEVVRRRIEVHGNGHLFPSKQSATGHMDQKVIGVAIWFHMPYSRTRPEQERPRLPVTQWSAHDLRRSVRTLLAKMGCDSEVAEAVLGHMQEGIKGVYNLHRYDKERREWLTKLDSKLEELAASR